MVELQIEMLEEEIQKDALSAVKIHNFSGLEEVTGFIDKVNKALDQVKK